MATRARGFHESRALTDRDYLYVWVDSVHTGVRLGSDGRLCCLVVLGARLDGTKELVAVEDGYRESEESWAALLRDLKKRGMRAPELAVGDGALGFWSALRDVFPETRVQRDWVHKTTNVLDSMPKSVHPRANPPSHVQPDRERLRAGSGEDGRDEGSGFEGGGPGL
jgi:putative transposase